MSHQDQSRNTGTEVTRPSPGQQSSQENGLGEDCGTETGPEPWRLQRRQGSEPQPSSFPILQAHPVTSFPEPPPPHCLLATSSLLHILKDVHRLLLAVCFPGALDGGLSHTLHPHASGPALTLQPAHRGFCPLPSRSSGTTFYVVGSTPRPGKSRSDSSDE